MENKRTGTEEYDRHVRRRGIALLAASVLLLVLTVLYMGIGTLSISPGEILAALLGRGDATVRTAVLNIRLPRALAAVLVGAVLAMSGTVMQCVLRNPLASASTLGVSQGAAFGAAVGILVFGGGAVVSSNSMAAVRVNSPAVVTLCAFVFGSVSSLAVIGISRVKRDAGPTGLILAGTALSAMFTGGSTLLQYFADDTSLGAVVFWTFGNLGNAGWKDLAVIAAAACLALVFYLANSWNYNAMTAGTDTALSLGVEADRTMLISMAVCSLSAAAAVSFVGIIGFVGLIAPHIMRRFTGSDHRFLLPGSALGGAILLILADAAAKLIAPPIVLPVGALLSFVGGPVFLILFIRGGKSHA